MAPRYYAVNVNGDGHIIGPESGPHPTYDQALDWHKRAYLMEPPRALDGVFVQPPTEGRRVLLDLGSIVPCDKECLDQLLAHDPVLAALFRLGQSIGMAQAGGQP